MPEVRRIAKHKHLPKNIKKTGEKMQIQRDSERRKEDNRRKHSKPGAEGKKKLRDAAVLKELT